jgi:hypothetical protein
MTLPTSGPISLVQVRAELGTGGPISLDQPDVRALAGVDTGAIGLLDLRGKTGPGSGAAMTVTATDGADTGEAPGSAFTAYAYPSVSVAGGTAPFTYTWTIATQDDDGFTLSSADVATCEVSHRIGKYGYIGQCTLSCLVSDNAGNTQTASGVVAYFDYQQKSSDIPQ